MTGAEDTSLTPARWVAPGEAAAEPAIRPRRRLFRKYALLFVGLVGAALLINSGFDFWFSYQENKAALVRVQQEKAKSAAQRIAEFVEEIKSQIGWTTHAQWSAGPLDQRRQDYVRLLRQVPAITELAQLDGQGKEQLKVSRLAMDVVGSEADFSQTPAFTEAKAHRTWFSPVYFRKESEPYMTLAMARDGKNAGVTVAEINLKLIWDVITALKIGQGGYAYVVDGRGRLIAHPDISLVLRDTDLSKLPQVAAALAPTPGDSVVTVAKSLGDRSVLTAHAAIPQLGWRVFVEVPLSEAFAPLYGAALRTLLLLGFGLIAATLVALVIARRMTGPIRALQKGAAEIGAGDLARRIDIHTGDELEGLAQQFNSMAGDLQKSYAELEQRVADRTAELSEALDQQTATAEVLGVINSSPGDLAPVFDAMLARALRLCEAAFGVLTTWDGERYHHAASQGLSAELLEAIHWGEPFTPNPGSVADRMVRGENIISTTDLVGDESFRNARFVQIMVRVGGARSYVSVALRHDEKLLGAIAIYRQEVRPFTDKQIALLQNFAAQAVIAIENARLITETREALDQQTATAEVLGVINASPGDLVPVFDAILDKAHTLCGATQGVLATYDGEYFRAVVTHGLPEPFAELLRQPFTAGPGSTQEQLLRGDRLVHAPDMTAVPSGADSPIRRASSAAGFRTMLMVPLRKDHTLLGYITAIRQEVRLFSEKQVALLENFAAQAVIAMENARLITETREALEQQTATAEVLGVINSSPGDLAPVFDAMLEKAVDLCRAQMGALWTYDGEYLDVVAIRDATPAYAAFLREGRHRPNQVQQRVLSGHSVQVPDIAASDRYRNGEPLSRAVVDLGGVRTLLAVPLRKDETAMGIFGIYRREPRPFSEKQIALLQNFAAQAVIAMENARLITETQEALEQQTATAEVLGVINSSPGDLAPVFDAMLDRALSLCGAAFGNMLTWDGEFIRLVASRGASAKLVEALRQPFRPVAGSMAERIVRGENVISAADLRDEESYRVGAPGARRLVELGGARGYAVVALRKDGELLGVISIYRREPLAFTDKQIALLQNFAAQAVIAMENARLITETREALEQQTATAEVLGVINSSPGDLAPVFDAILEKAHSLCGAAHGVLVLRDGENFRAVGARGLPEGFAERLRRGFPGADNPVAEPLLAGAPFVQLADISRIDHPITRAGGGSGLRTLMAVALRKDGALLGWIVAARREVRAFSEKEIALLQNFAAQAVIAMENARLITETREALEQQTATAEVLGVINSSPGELAPVFDAMLDKALNLCGAAFGVLRTYDGEWLRTSAQRGVPPALADFIREPNRLASGDGNAIEALIGGAPLVHVADIRESESNRAGNPFRRALAERGGARTTLWVALRRDEVFLGAIILYRQEVRPFSDKQIALLRNFAAQAVIAMENARLITETRERTRDLQESLEYQTATSDVLKVISQSDADLNTVLQTVLDTAASLCEADAGNIFLRRGERLERKASIAGTTSAGIADLAAHPILIDRRTTSGRAVLTGQVTHIADITVDPDFDHPTTVAAGVRTMLGVPLLREDNPIGSLSLVRYTVKPFTHKQIELVRTFADQAVIAIENARLLGELRSRTDELAHSVEELKALSEVGQAVSSTLDLRSVLVTVLNRSVALAGADAGVIFRYSRPERAFRFVEAVGYSEAMVRDVRDLDVGENVTGMGIAIANRAPLQIPDLRERAPNPLRDQALAAGYRSVLIVPLVGADRIMGATILQRRAIGEFPEATVRLMQTLASQSVLAIQNARLFREIADTSEELRLASEHKSQFLANMSHELRTPLNAILGYTELLVDGIYGEVSPRALGVLERVQNNGKHLLALINDVLDLSKIEAGQLTLTMEDYALPDVVQSVVSATEPLASTKGLKFTATIAPDLPTGHGDARRLSQVLLNLVGNAIKFTDEGEVEVRALTANGDFVLTVRDTGPGIADTDQERIFGEFQQIDNSATRKKGGTGLGLAISKRMVEMQGGTISVESEPGHGATFRVTLPVRVEEMPEALMGAA